ncbi:hypothetical protein [Nocardioides sp.]|uniref:hypothetical protein n=1 Tax=Nocardioides sp. TaxID=35761 RepID=UPI0035127BC8
MRLPLPTRRLLGLLLLPALVLGLLALAPARGDAEDRRGVRPAKGYYGWVSEGEDDGREFVNLQVRGRRTADVDSLGALCDDRVPVFTILGGPERETRVRGNLLRKRVEVAQEGEVAVISLRVRWVRPALARGWIRVTGRIAGADCRGGKTRVELTRVTGADAG